MNNLKPCPFCGGEPKHEIEQVRIGYSEYEHVENYHVVKCANCSSNGPRCHQKHLAEFTAYTVADFRNNPILRAKVEEDYENYCREIKRHAISAWNRRKV
jgi:hypothetical protein